MYALRYPEELKGIVLFGTGARLRVHSTYLDRCNEPVSATKCERSVDESAKRCFQVRGWGALPSIIEAGSRGWAKG
ncbi:MAG: hypothetical protein BZY75_01295 [SAR202 cluster bacterium Io17-Chloro-G7]|nr:MAG: hypothetical protein BZY75_01295 [SAR202 cluster bacterium Io17-Chloro-G7]